MYDAAIVTGFRRDKFIPERLFAREKRRNRSGRLGNRDPGLPRASQSHRVAKPLLRVFLLGELLRLRPERLLIKHVFTGFHETQLLARLFFYCAGILALQAIHLVP